MKISTPGKFEIVLADFPWFYTPYGTQKITYPMMTYAQVARFDWSPILAKSAAVFCWTTGPKKEAQMRAMRCWRRQGLYFQGEAFVWIKTKQDGTPIGASGVRPRVIKPLTESVLVYTTNEKNRVFKVEDEGVVQTVFAPKAGSGRHSAKPKIHDRIERVYGDRPRIELFCRGASPEGWAAHGDEATTHESRCPVCFHNRMRLFGPDNNWSCPKCPNEVNVTPWMRS